MGFVRYGIERLLFRLSRSPHADRFLLKGAILFAVRDEKTHRPTRDLDLPALAPWEKKSWSGFSGKWWHRR
jgi:hypothetical protein